METSDNDNKNHNEKRLKPKNDDRSFEYYVAKAKVVFLHVSMMTLYNIISKSNSKMYF